jgi:molybdopterin adenylyltransferase
LPDAHKAKSHAAESHKHEARPRLRIALITVSSSRYRDPSIRDDSGEEALALCRKADHDATLEVVDDDKQMIRLHALRALFEESSDSVILLGGTGLAPRDVTIEAIAPLLEKKLEGFGEIFRRLSYDSIGSPALMTRSIAGVIGTKPVFCLPGSPDAAKLGIELILKELPHAVYIAGNPP